MVLNNQVVRLNKKFRWQLHTEKQNYPKNGANKIILLNQVDCRSVKMILDVISVFRVSVCFLKQRSQKSII